jgi:hypothetical protein
MIIAVDREEAGGQARVEEAGWWRKGRPAAFWLIFRVTILLAFRRQHDRPAVAWQAGGNLAGL